MVLETPGFKLDNVNPVHGLLPLLSLNTFPALEALQIDSANVFFVTVKFAAVLIERV